MKIQVSGELRNGDQQLAIRMRGGIGGRERYMLIGKSCH